MWYTDIEKSTVCGIKIPLKQEKTHKNVCFSVLVEMGGVEPPCCIQTQKVSTYVSDL